MTSLLVLIPLALALGVGALFAFFWALRGGQFDDLEGSGSRILFDEDRPAPTDQPKITSPRRS